MGYITERETLFTVEEIIEKSQYVTLGSVRHAIDVYTTIREQYNHPGDERWDTYLSLAILYEAGRIQGKREDRKRRKEAHRNNL